MAEIRPLRLSDAVVKEQPIASERPVGFPVETEEERRAREGSARDLIQKEASEAKAKGDTAGAAARASELKRIPGKSPAKTPKWREITSSPKYQALDSDGRESVRLDYWQNYVSPQIATEDLESARVEFDELTKPTLTQRVKKAVKGVVEKISSTPPDERTWEAPESDIDVLNEERRAAQPARATATPKGGVQIAPADLSLQEPEQPSAPWTGEGGVLTNAPAGMVAAGKNAIANLQRMAAEEEVEGRTEALAPGSDQAGYRASAAFRKLEQAAQARHKKGIEEATKAGEQAKLWAAQTQRELQLVTPQDMDTTQQAVWSFVQSTPPTLLGISIGILTRNPLAAMAIAGGGGSAFQAGSTYGEAREKGAPHRLAAMASAIDGVLEGVGEAIPLATALKPGSSFLVRLGKVIPQEAGQEGITQLAQDLNAYLTYNPNITLQEAWQNFKVATLAGAIGGTVYGTVGAAATGKEQQPVGAIQPPDEKEPPARPGVDLSDPAGLSRAVAGEEPLGALQEPGSEALDVGAVRGREEAAGEPVAAPAPAAATTAPTLPAGATPVKDQPAKKAAKPAEAVKPKEEAGAAAPPAPSGEKPQEPAKTGAQPVTEKPAPPSSGETEPPPPRGSRRLGEGAGPSAIATTEPEQNQQVGGERIAPVVQPSDTGIAGAAEGLKKIFESPVDEKAHEAASSPLNDKTATPKQILANNAELGHPRVAGMEISTENPAGSVRRDLKNDPPKWQVEMKGAHYGYIRNTIGFDKDHLDIFVKEGTPEDWTGTVYVINQNKAGNGHFDEHKAMAGFASEQEARETYLGNFDDRARAEKLVRSIVPLELKPFKAWAYDKTEKGPRGGELKGATDAIAEGEKQRRGQPERERDGERVQGGRQDRGDAPAKPAPRPEDRGRGGDEQSRQAPQAERPAALVERPALPGDQVTGYGTLEGREVTLELEVEGKKAKITMNAAAAMRDVDRRISTMRELVECLR